VGSHGVWGWGPMGCGGGVPWGVGVGGHGVWSLLEGGVLDDGRQLMMVADEDDALQPRALGGSVGVLQHHRDEGLDLPNRASDGGQEGQRRRWVMGMGIRAMG
jgi:hypothetical protein